jgi:5-methylcytosine-specific restriction endonuclease McrA
MSFSYDHIKPRLTHPHLTYEPTNGQAAHLKCNQAKGTGPGRPALGQTSSGW